MNKGCFSANLVSSKSKICNLLLPAFAAAVVGGLGSPYGAIAAGLLIGIAQNVATLWIADPYKIAFAFVILIVTLLFKPNGLTGKGSVAR